MGSPQFVLIYRNAGMVPLFRNPRSNRWVGNAGQSVSDGTFRWHAEAQRLCLIRGLAGAYHGTWSS